MTVTIYDRSMDGSAGAAHRAGLIPGERQAPEAWLDFHRDTLLLKCADLTAGQLKQRAAPPSRLSLLRPLRHMTEVERCWSRIHAANTGLPFPYNPDQTGQDFEALEDADAAADIKAFKLCGSITGSWPGRTPVRRL